MVFFISTVKVVQDMDPPPQPPSSKIVLPGFLSELYVEHTVIDAHLQAFYARRTQH